MALYAIGDLHLSLNSNKSMEVFGPAWENYTERIRASLSQLTAEDVLVLAGDTSWGMSLEESVEDFRFLEQFPCKKYLIKGNHDEMLRKFAGFKMGSLKIVNKVILELDEGKTAWFFHGDVFDVTMQHSKWLAKLGAVGYDTLILINRVANFISEKIFRRGKLSLSKKIKNSVKSAVKFINSFEQTAADIGISNKYDYVVCGHIHQPEIKEIVNEEGKIIYLNSGDWIENLTALEYAGGKWEIYRFDEIEMLNMSIHDQEEELNNNQLFDNLVEEFNLLKQS